jgi:phage anti-repressor protein
MNNLTVIENELVPVYETSTGEKVVYGSELHEVLGVRTPYKDWSTRRLNDIDAVENEDFEAAQICAPSGQTKKDHIIKLDIAKEMAMLERNDKGKEVRRYFIRVEKKYKAASLATQELSPQLQVMINLEIEQKRQAEKIEHVEERIESIREVVAIDTTSWRDDTGRILRKIGMECGDSKSYQDVRAESYQLLEKRMGVNVKQRLTNKRRRMADEGVCKSKRDKLNYLDVIADDKKLIEGYTAIVKELAIKYGVA